ncbi:glycoside hydrolase family 43 protein [Negadavirga shengliensis]
MTARKANLPLIGMMVLGLVACQQGSHKEKDKVSESTTFTNPVFDEDFADPTPVKAGDGYYYVYATNSQVDGETIHIQVAKSSDLVNWERTGDALPEKPNWADKDFWAPHVHYDPGEQRYYLYYSGESIDGQYGKCLGVATSNNPAGPFRDKGEPLLCGDGFINIDPMSFDDPVTGKKYLYWGSGFEAIKVQELSDDRLSFKEGSEPIDLINPIADESPDNYQRLVEGAWVVYRNGYYYLFYSGDNCCGEQAHYAVMVARAEHATGPFQTLAEATGSENSVIMERSGRWIAPGHNSLIRDDAGQDWIFYHAIDSQKGSGGRMMLMDKITYEDGWPVIANGMPSEKNIPGPVIE